MRHIWHKMTSLSTVDDAPDAAAPDAAAPDAALEDAPDTLDAADSDEECGFCCDANVECLHSNYSKCLDPPIKRIMACELLLHGFVSDKAIYRQMCHEYNSNIHAKLISSGLKSTKWESKKLKEHFDKHVNLLPRRVVAEQLKMLTRLSRMNYRQAKNEICQNSEDPLDIKFVQKAVSLTGVISKLIKEHHTYVKEDMEQTKFESTWRDKKTHNANELMQVKHLVYDSSLAQAPIGKGDRPTASTLFDM